VIPIRTQFDRLDSCPVCQSDKNLSFKRSYTIITHQMNHWIICIPCKIVGPIIVTHPDNVNFDLIFSETKKQWNIYTRSIRLQRFPIVDITTHMLPGSIKHG